MKKSKTVISLFLTLMIIFTLAGCGEVKKAETAVNGMFNALKSADAKKASEFLNLDELKNTEDDSDSLTNNTEFLVKNMFKNLDYKIISSEKKDASTVIVKTKITTTDMKPVMGEFFAAAMQYAFATAFSDPQPSEEESNKKMEELFVTSITKPDLSTVTNTVDITVVKVEDNNWKIKSDDPFINAVLGGLADAAKEISKSFDTAQ